MKHRRVAMWATWAGGICELDAAEYFRTSPSLAAELAAMATPGDPWILVAHAPPHDTKLDRLPNLDYPIGSKAVRAQIEAHPPGRDGPSHDAVCHCEVAERVPGGEARH